MKEKKIITKIGRSVTNN